MSVRITNNMTLGVSMAHRGLNSTAQIGYALLNKAYVKTIDRRSGDVLSMARAAAQDKKDNGEELTIYRYCDDVSYRNSIAFNDGLCRQKHWDMISKIAETLSSEGYDIHIVEVNK